MSRTTLMIAALLLVAACAGEDPAAQTAAPAPTTTIAQTTPTSATPEADHDDEADHGEEAEHGEDHEDDADEATHDEATDHDDDAMAEGRVIEVTMTEFAFEPSTIEVTPGETVIFVTKNEGAIEHELRLSNAHRIEEHIASGHADHDDEGGHHDENADIILLVGAGETAELVFEVPEDATFYTHAACLLPGHYEAGMVADLTTG